MRRTTLAAVILLAATACASSSKPPLATVPQVDLPRFMGDWYVVASIPTALEKGAHNAVESYALAADGTIETTFTFRQGSFDGPEKRYTPRGFVREGSGNATWGMRFVWPFKAEYLVIYLDEAYRTTIIGRTARDYVWIMAREPSIPEEEYQGLVRFLAERGYDASKLEKVPQRWPGRDGAPTSG
jgi:apolipoprotein D and lipocalin family protein